MKAISRAWEISRATYYPLLLVSKLASRKGSKKNFTPICIGPFLFKKHTVLTFAGPPPELSGGVAIGTLVHF
jgi:hypothetical protein